MTAKYVQSGQLCFELITSAPITWVEWILVFRPGCDSDSGAFSLIKAPLRLLRPLRLLKVAKMLRIFKRLQKKKIGFHHRLKLWQQKLLGVALLFCGIIHVFNCIFWLIKEMSTTDEEMLDFLIQHNIMSENSEPGDPDWFKTSEATFLIQRYVLSGYFINTVMTTVGFGDIAGTSVPERLFLIVAMWVGLLLFSLIVSEVEGMVSRCDAHKNECRRYVSEFEGFLEKEMVPKSVQADMLEWVKFSYTTETERVPKQQSMCHLFLLSYIVLLYILCMCM